MTTTATKLFVTKVDLEHTHVRAQNALMNPWVMHTNLAPITGVGAGEDGRALYRLETPDGAPPYLLIQTPRELDFSPLVASGVARSVKTKCFSPEEIPDDAVLEFRTLVVATKDTQNRSRKVEDRSKFDAELTAMLMVKPDLAVTADQIAILWTKHDESDAKIGWSLRLKDGSSLKVGRRAPRGERAVSESDMGEWLKRQLVGADVLDWCVVGFGNYSATRYTSSDRSHKIAWRGYTVIGSLSINDSAKFAKTIAAGIGRARGFGFGLVSLARRKGVK